MCFSLLPVSAIAEETEADLPETGEEFNEETPEEIPPAENTPEIAEKTPPPEDPAGTAGETAGPVCYEAAEEQEESTVQEESELSASSEITAFGTCGDSLNWELDTDGLLTVSGSGALYNYSIGESPWYDYRELITDIVLSDGITRIGDYAFIRWSNITSIDIPRSVTSIGNYAFYWCIGLTSVTIPGSVTSIGEAAYFGCTGLTSVTIPDGVMSIDDEAFCDCSGLTRHHSRQRDINR